MTERLPGPRRPSRVHACTGRIRMRGWAGGTSSARVRGKEGGGGGAGWPPDGGIHGMCASGVEACQCRAVNGTAASAWSNATVLEASFAPTVPGRNESVMEHSMCS